MKCHKCGYEWQTKSELAFISCPSCGAKVKKTDHPRWMTNKEIFHSRNTDEMD